MSTVKVNTVDKRTGGTLTLGGCGTTVTLGAGATQSGFGRTGTVDWCTTAKTAPFTGVSGNGYFVNTTSGAVTVTLPASPSAGDIISIADYASTFQTNNLTLCRNSSKINGACTNASLSTEGQSITLVYVDATRGWKNTMDSTSNVTGQPNFIQATGGTITCCGDYKIHTFTSDGCFSVSSAPTPANNTVDYLVVAGGGGGGFADIAGAGGAGGFRLSNSTSMPAPLTSPLANPTGLPVSVQSYPITVGAGGGPTTFPGVNNTPIPGSNSIFSTITSAGGGGGGAESSNPVISFNGRPGGSGGGGSYGASVGGTGNTPPTSPPQGNPGGNGSPSGPPAFGQGGGGGAGAAGCSGSPTAGGNGGIGSYVLTTGFAGANGTTGPVCGARYFAGGGGSSTESGGGATPGSGGAGGGGSGGRSSPTIPAVSGTTNTGGGGGGGENGASALASGAGGSGIVIIRYKYQ
jgi:hypothetical protein